MREWERGGGGGEDVSKEGRVEARNRRGRSMGRRERGGKKERRGGGGERGKHV